MYNDKNQDEIVYLYWLSEANPLVGSLERADEGLDEGLYLSGRAVSWHPVCYGVSVSELLIEENRLSWPSNGCWFQKKLILVKSYDHWKTKVPCWLLAGDEDNSLQSSNYIVLSWDGSHLFRVVKGGIRWSPDLGSRILSPWRDKLKFSFILRQKTSSKKVRQLNCHTQGSGLVVIS